MGKFHGDYPIGSSDYPIIGRADARLAPGLSTLEQHCLNTKLIIRR